MMNKTEQLTITVLGYLVRGPMGGMAWHHLQYLMGLRDLGHEVYFLEDSGDTPWCCYNPTRGVTDVDPSYGLSFAGAVLQRVGLGDRWAYYDVHTSHWSGPCADRIGDICARSDVLLNLSFSNPVRPWTAEIPVRALVETDPAFTQIRNLADSARKEQALRHTAFFSFGENLGRDGCRIPDDGLPWQTTRQPIVLDAWPVVPAPQNAPLTTVMQWDSYAVRKHGGESYGMKSASFNPFRDLPRQSPIPLELALGGPSAPRAELRSGGWKLSDPLQMAQDPWRYQRYIQQSRGEFSVAKHGYVVSHSGWFSERSAAYLASGRPVIVQDTGFSDWLEVGRGVLPFRTFEGALAAIDDVNRGYQLHARAAREIAAEYFAADRVLSRLLEQLAASSTAVGRGAHDGSQGTVMR